MQILSLLLKYPERRFCTRIGDLGIYQNTDKQGLWVGWLNDKPIDVLQVFDITIIVSWIVYNEKYRGRGFGLQLWSKALSHLSDLPCVGLEAFRNY